MSRTAQSPVRWWHRCSTLVATATLVAVLPTVVSGPVDAAPAGWDETDTGLEGSAPEIVLDPGDDPRVLYGDLEGGLRFGWCDGGCQSRSGWRSVELVDGVDLEGHELTIDRSGRLHAAYIDLAADGVFYATCDSGCGDAGSWDHAKVDTTTNQNGLSLAVDPWGRPRLAFKRYPAVEMVFAACDTACSTTGRWSTAVLNSNGGDQPSLAFDGAKPRLAYAKSVSPRGFDLRFASCEADCLNRRAWATTTVTWFDGVGGPSLVIDRGRPHVSFNPNGAAATTLAYTRCDSGCSDGDNWEEPAFITPGERAWGHELGVIDGHPRIAFRHCEACLTAAEQNHVKYATCGADCTGRNAGGWSVETLASPGRPPRLALDGGRPHVVYRDGQDSGVRDLRYGFCEGCGTAGSWPAPPSGPPPASWPPPGSSGGGSGGESGNEGPAGGGSGGEGTETGSGSRGGGSGGSGGSGPAGGGAGTSGPGSGSTPATSTGSGEESGVGVVGGSERSGRSASGDGNGAGGGRRVMVSEEGGGGVGDRVARVPGAAIDVVRNPSQALSWPWGRILLKGLALALFAVVARLAWVVAVAQRRPPATDVAGR